MFTICFSTPIGWNDIAFVDGCEAAYAIYRKACELGAMLGVEVALCDTQTGKALARFSEEDGLPTENLGFQGNSCDPEFGPMKFSEFGEL